MADPAIWFPAIRAGTGTDTFTIRLANALNRRGIRAEITWLPHRAEYAPWTVKPPQVPAWANIVHINSWLHDRFISHGLPIVTTLHSCVHDPALLTYKTQPQMLYHRFWIKRLEANALRKSAAITAVSQYTAKQAAYVFDQHDITPIPNWVDNKQFSPSERQEPFRPFRLFFAGNLSRRKGADLLPKIMRQLGSDFVLHYTGNPEGFGDTGHVLENMIALGRLCGDAAMAAAYRNCDALLFPTRLEGFALVALEAQACGRPVIATDSSSLPEMIEHGKTGILCPVDDVGAFVMAAFRLHDEQGLWGEMSIAAREHVKLFAEETAVMRYIEIYRTLAHDSSAAFKESSKRMAEPWST